LDGLRLEIKSAPHAFAELFGNARDLNLNDDPLDLQIEVIPTPSSKFGSFELRVSDNGPAVHNLAAVNSMIGLGFSDKSREQTGQCGLTHAGMRLADNVLAFVKAKSVAYIVLMSPKYMEDKGKEVGYPFAKFSPDTDSTCTWESGAPLSEFVAYSNFTDEQGLLEVFAKMPATGVQYILYNLRNERKYDVTSDPFDVRVLSAGAEGDGQQPSLAPGVGQATGAKVRNARHVFPRYLPSRTSAI
jgi:hypothetical protein